MKAVKFKEFLCVVVLALFIAFLTNGTSVSDKSAQEVFEKVSATVDMAELAKCDKAKLKKETGFEAGQFEDVLFYASDNVMQVREIMIVKLKEETQAQPLMKALEKRVSQKANLFKGYAPEQSAMLESYVLESRGGFVFFCVCEKPQMTLNTFKNAL